MFEEIKNINPSKKELKKFGITFGIILAIIISFLFYKQKLNSVWFYIIPAFFILTGIFTPISLKNFFRIWMSFAIVMQWIVTHLILTVLFYVVITPIGMISRLFRKDILSLRFKTDATTYWQKREKKSNSIKDYERQF